MQYTAIFHGWKKDNFQMKNCDGFLTRTTRTQLYFNINHRPHASGKEREREREREIMECAFHDETRIDVYETLCPQQMLVHKGGKIKNWGGECRDVTPTKSLSQNIRVDENREVKFL